jgi:hypothetical protein
LTLCTGRIRNDFGIWVGVATLLAAAFTDLAFNYKSVLGGFSDSIKVVGMAMRDAKANKEAQYVRSKIRKCAAEDKMPFPNCNCKPSIPWVSECALAARRLGEKEHFPACQFIAFAFD